ncbi:DEAD/DEAH box helicase [Enterococcus asini]|uniref:DEAD/DEAH box helicase n=1 Tax=Enterococcus asini TaxID=57732 RepID=UPI0028927EA4|nr:DEAD/DEAH box helicase [Enterococcus asini]MDT2783601.1 DEAD/DEAH box helicase [Enterococcus asini]
MIQLYDYQQDLVDRARQAYHDGYHAPCIVSPCGSGKSVMVAEIAKLTTQKGNHVLFLVHRKELIDQIRGTFRAIGVDGSMVDFGMVQTVVRRLDRMRRPGLIITDENHHGLAGSYRKIYDFFSDVPRLGFTATPVRLNGGGLGDVNDLLIEGVSVSWLIEHHRLAPYEYYAPKLIDTDALKKASTGDYTKQSMDNAVKSTIYGDVIKHYRDLAEGEQAIAYCHSIEASLHTASVFNANGYPAAHIDAKTPKDDRAAIIQKFREGEIKILCNVDLIGEGFDVPDCSTVIMLRPTKSLSLFIQQSMRGMRYKPGKKSIIIDHVGNVNSFGLPDMEREWSLESKKKTNTDSDISVVQCVKCFGAYARPRGENVCPYCGHVQPIEERKTELEIDESAELVKVGETKVVLDLEKAKYFNMTEDEAESIGDLYKIAKAKGFKPGWAYMAAKRRGMLI